MTLVEPETEEHVLELDDYLKKQGIVDIRRVKNYLIINADNIDLIKVKIKKNQKSEDILSSLEENLDKPLGRDLCQYLMKFICKDENWNILTFDGNDSTEIIKQPTEKKPKDVYVQRFSNGQYHAEAVLIDNIPKFLLMKDGQISKVDYIAIGDEIIKPLRSLSYINKPYSFSSNEEVDSIIEKASNEKLDTLYVKVKSQWKRFVNADDFHISICAADTIFTHFQNIAGMTHYLFFVGGPGSGKSNNLEVFHYLAYRNMTSTGITAPNIYAFYGSREEGIGTICEDEANDLDQNEDKMKFYKNGYTKNHPVIRQDENGNEGGGRVPRRYYTYGWKAFAAEQLPDSVIAMGFLDRVIVLECVYGFPEYDINEVTNPMEDEKFSHLLQELSETRNLLFMYGFLHHADKFPDIKLNLTGREKQLFKPILRIFQGTRTQEQLKPIISDYINDRRANAVDSLHAYLYGLITKLIKKTGSNQLTNQQIWDQMMIDLEGNYMYGGTTSFMSAGFGKLTQNQITRHCREIFGAKPSRDRKSRGHIFDKIKMDQLKNLYDLTLELKIGETVTDVTHFDTSGHTGLDKHFKISTSDQENEHDLSEKTTSKTDENKGAYL